MTSFKRTYSILICLILLICKCPIVKSNSCSLFDLFAHFNQNSEEFVSDLDLSESCRDHIMMYTDGIYEKAPWALSMLDATAKLQSGLLTGNHANYGSFDQCLNIAYETKSHGVIRGKHCMMFAHMKLNQNMSDMFSTIFNSQIPHKSRGLNLTAGVCLPASCSSLEIQEIIEKVLDHFEVSLTEQNGEIYCSTKEPLEFSTADYIALTVFSIFVILVIISSVYEDICRNYNWPMKNLYKSFSAFQNLNKLLKISHKPDQIKCLHGLRAISIIWIVFMHRYFVNLFVPMDNTSEMVEWLQNPINLLKTSATVSVDTFLVLSGFLVAYVYDKRDFLNAKNRIMNILLLFFHRYLRITTSFAAMIWFQATLMIHMGNGPYWKSLIGVFKENCVNYWYYGLLYVQNYISSQNICVGISWYLSVDFHLFIMAPILLLGLKKYPKLSLLAISGLIVASIFYILFVTIKFDFSASPIPFINPEHGLREAILYLPTHARLSPWLLGLLLGANWGKVKDLSLNFPKYAYAIGWTIWCLLILAVILPLYHFQQVSYVKNVVEGAFYLSLSRVAWGAAICWLIFACSVGKGAFINWFLSLSFWQPLSKLSFCIYLTHLPVQLMITAHRRQPAYFHETDIAYSISGDFGIVLIVSVLWYLLFESSTAELEKRIIKYLRSKIPGLGEDPLPMDLLNSTNADQDNSNEEIIELNPHYINSLPEDPDEIIAVHSSSINPLVLNLGEIDEGIDEDKEEGESDVQVSDNNESEDNDRGTTISENRKSSVQSFEKPPLNVAMKAVENTAEKISRRVSLDVATEVAASIATKVSTVTAEKLLLQHLPVMAQTFADCFSAKVEHRISTEVADRVLNLIATTFGNSVTLTDMSNDIEDYTGEYKRGHNSTSEIAANHKDEKPGKRVVHNLIEDDGTIFCIPSASEALLEDISFDITTSADSKVDVTEPSVIKSEDEIDLSDKQTTINDEKEILSKSSEDTTTQSEEIEIENVFANISQFFFDDEEEEEEKHNEVQVKEVVVVEVQDENQTSDEQEVSETVIENNEGEVIRQRIEIPEDIITESIEAQVSRFIL